ncbi:MAG: hypothetical protein LUH82_00840 [Clostridiales bacterium]|nr:hypothetical protein [Clostridiales bacterium]
MNYNETLSLIKDKEKSGIKPGTGRIKRALTMLGEPQNKIKCVHIAGTNGKGSVAAAIAASLAGGGFRTGLFTSPWVIDYREQIQINGVFISKENLTRLFNSINTAFPELTEFETLTVAAFEYFFEQKADFAVIECGMGGRLDATNVIASPLVSVITEISQDHTDFLGDSVFEIAENKAGIIKQNSVAVLYPNGSAGSVFEKVCKENNTRLIKVPDMGSFAENNRETARLCLNAMGLDIEVELPQLPARLEKIGENVLLDGSHNISAAMALRQYLQQHQISAESAVISMMKDKKADEYIKIIAPFCKKIFTCSAANPRAMGAVELCKIAEKYCSCAAACESPGAALRCAMSGGGFVLLCGSFYLARELRNELIKACAESK